MLLINFFVKMKKLFISVATLMFVTLLFAQDDAEVDTEMTQDSIIDSELNVSTISQNL